LTVEGELGVATGDLTIVERDVSVVTPDRHRGLFERFRFGGSVCVLDLEGERHLSYSVV